MGVSKNREKTPKIDGEKHPVKMDDLGGKPPLFSVQHPNPHTMGSIQPMGIFSSEKKIPRALGSQFLRQRKPVATGMLHLTWSTLADQKPLHPWKFNIAPENGWLEELFPIEIVRF